MVQFWPFSSLLTLAAFHLFNIIDFYINLLWKVLALLLAAYNYVLDQKVSRLERKCDRLNQSATVVNQLNCKIDANRVKDQSSRLAQRERQSQQCSSSDRQCAQPLLPSNR